MKKRSNGEGSFRKLPSGNWSGQIMVGYTPEGKRRVKTFTAPTKSEVQRKIREYMDGLVEEEKAKSRIPFSAWADKWYRGWFVQIDGYIHHYINKRDDVLPELRKLKKIRREIEEGDDVA